MSYGLLGLGNGLQEFAKIFLAHDREENQRKEYQKNLDLATRRTDAGIEHDLAMRKLQERELELQREAGQRAQAGLDLQTQTHSRQMQGDIRDQIGRLGPGAAVPGSLVSDAEKFGISDQVINRMPEGMSMAPGEQAPASGLPADMLISQNYSRDMLSPDQRAEETRKAEEHTAQLGARNKQNAYLDAQIKYLGQLGAAAGEKQDTLRPELARNIGVFAAALNTARNEYFSALKPLQSLGLLPAQRQQAEAAATLAKRQMEQADWIYKMALTAITGKELNPEISPDSLNTLKTGIPGLILNDPPKAIQNPAPAPQAQPAQRPGGTNRFNR
jgi:hypothetical protein